MIDFTQLAASTTPGVIALPVAVIAAIASIVAAQMSRKAQKDAAESAKTTAAMDRFGPWQLRKREEFAALLEAGHKLQGAGDASRHELDGELRLTCDRATLYANPDLRVELIEFYDNPRRVDDPELWRSLVEELRIDVLQTGPMK